ncbi:cytochrome c3 family protein [Mesobacillus maritimus]|uniref:cytochrome c3 family protein n=1 Tax=Mesobacillus maritimus TaxID=1643336 RepID=UPI00384E5D1B
MKKFSFSLLFVIMLFGIFTFAASAEDYNTPNTTPITVEPTIDNANDTGVGADAEEAPIEGEMAEVIKNVDGHKTHGEYQNNTNSCASCHQTHTSKGKQLLFADTTYQTCASCHDGTLGFYNVFESGENADLDGAGTFGGSHANNMSIHQSNDTVQVKAAPGGNKSSADAKTWGASFSCASCHAPHGSYSDRLLHYNPNGMATTPIKDGEDALTGGKQIVLHDVTTTKPAAGVYALVKETSTTEKVSDADEFAVKVYLYKGTTKQEVPMLYGYGSHGQPHFTHLAYTHPTHGTGRIEYGNADIYFSNEHGYFKALTKKGNEILTGSTSLKGQVSLAYVVKMDLQEVQDIDGLKIYKNNQSAYWTEKTLNNTGTTKDFVGQGVAMSEYCASCHTDYIAKSSSSSGIKSGTFEKAYRHTTNNASYTCVRCHFAHGTDAEIMMDAQGETVADLTATDGKFEGNKPSALEYMTDTNPSSALKKFTNMTVCWACHNSSKATTIKNTNRPEDHPNGMPKTDVDFGGTIKSIQR